VQTRSLRGVGTILDATGLAQSPDARRTVATYRADAAREPVLSRTTERSRTVLRAIGAASFPEEEERG
jgi:hypothetical protein